MKLFTMEKMLKSLMKKGKNTLRKLKERE